METTELILSEDDKNELKLMQDEFIKISKQKRTLKLKIEHFIKNKTVNILKPNKNDNNSLHRDIELVYNYLDLLNGKGAKTYELCNMLNDKLKNHPKRWNVKEYKNVKLDTSMFYNYLTLYLNKDNRFYKNNQYWQLTKYVK